MSNPYESPQQVGQLDAAESDRESLRTVARYQQWVLYALLCNIVANVAIIGAAAGGFQATSNLLSVVIGLPVIVFGMVAIFLLARELYHWAVGVLCALLMVVPCISLLTLLVVNGKATNHLQARGIKVGFMGANPDAI
jgi:hypothetical protein